MAEYAKSALLSSMEWYSCNSKAYRNKLTRFVKRYNGRAVAKCWNTWHTFHLGKVAEREAHEEQEARLKGFILKWKSDLKGSVFHKWHMAAVAEAKERAAAANALAIADMKKSMEAKLKAQEEKIKEDKMKRVLTRLRDSVVWSAFYTWKRHYIDEREAANRKRRMTAVSTKVQRIHDAYYTFSFAMYGIESKRQLFVALEKFARDAFNAIGGVLFMIDYDGDGSLWSFIEDGTREVRAPAGSGIAGSIVTQGKPISLPDARKHPQFSKIVDDAYTTAARSISFEDDDPDSIQALRLRAAPSPLHYVGVPVYDGNSVVAAFVITSCNAETREFLISHGPRITKCVATTVSSVMRSLYMLQNIRAENVQRKLTEDKLRADLTDAESRAKMADELQKANEELSARLDEIKALHTQSKIELEECASKAAKELHAASERIVQLEEHRVVTSGVSGELEKAFSILDEWDRHEERRKMELASDLGVDYTMMLSDSI